MTTHYIADDTFGQRVAGSGGGQIGSTKTSYQYEKRDS